MKLLLELKKKIAKKRSNYVRSDAFKRKCIPLQWRAPRGGHSKIRKKRRGKVSHPGPGVASPKAVRGLTMKGLKPVTVSTLKDLEKINPKTEAIIISKVGQKRRIELLKQAIAKNNPILNIRKPEEVIKKVEETIKKKQEIKKKKTETKKQKKEAAIQKAKEEEKKKTETTEEQEKPETAKGSKSEKIKTLEKRQ